MASSLVVRRLGTAVALLTRSSLGLVTAGCGDSVDKGNGHRIRVNAHHALQDQWQKAEEPQPQLVDNGNSLRSDDEGSGSAEGGDEFIPFTQAEVSYLLQHCTQAELVTVVKGLSPTEFAQLIHTATPEQRTQFVQIAGTSGLADLVSTIQAGDINQYQQCVTEDEWDETQSFLDDFYGSSSSK